MIILRAGRYDTIRFTIKVRISTGSFSRRRNQKSYARKPRRDDGNGAVRD